MNKSRKSLVKLQQRALLKCQQFWQGADHVDCTPAEYIALCYYFDIKPRDFQYYLDLVNKGSSCLDECRGDLLSAKQYEELLVNLPIHF